MSDTTSAKAKNAKAKIGAKRPNILLITCDQYRFPRFSYGPDHGFDEPLKEILGFQTLSHPRLNPYAKYFPGLLRLRENSVNLRNHTIAASAWTTFQFRPVPGVASFSFSREVPMPFG